MLSCGSDAAWALGYNEPHKAISRHCRCGMKRPVPHPQSETKKIEMLFIPEGDEHEKAKLNLGLQGSDATIINEPGLTFSRQFYEGTNAKTQ